MLPIFLYPHPKGIKQLTDLLPATDHMPTGFAAITVPNGAGPRPIPRPPRTAHRRAWRSRAAAGIAFHSVRPCSAIAQRTTEDPEKVRAGDRSIFEHDRRCGSDDARSQLYHCLEKVNVLATNQVEARRKRCVAIWQRVASNVGVAGPREVPWHGRAVEQ